ncbi:MAG: response regulator transcription factor [Burkholderiales bacterium]
MLRVLLAEDSEAIRERLVESFESIPNVVVVGMYEDPDAAIAGIQQHQPDVVLLDIRLRNGSGMRVLQHTAHSHPSTKVAILSNFNEPQYRAACIKNGAHYFFDKSNEFEKVPELLKQLAGTL